MAPQLKSSIVNTMEQFYTLISSYQDPEIFTLLVKYLNKPEYPYFKNEPCLNLSLSEEQATLLWNIKFSNMNTLKEYTAETISDLLTDDPELQANIINELSHPVNLFLWAHELTHEQLNVILNILAPELRKNEFIIFVRDISGFSQLIQKLDQQHLSLILEIMAPQLKSSIVNTMEQFYTLISSYQDPEIFTLLVKYLNKPNISI